MSQSESGTLSSSQQSMADVIASVRITPLSYRIKLVPIVLLIDAVYLAGLTIDCQASLNRKRLCYRCNLQGALKLSLKTTPLNKLDSLQHDATVMLAC